MSNKLILKLDRGADGVLNLNNQLNYAVLNGLQMRVAKRARGQLGGHGPYMDVDFVIPLRVFSKIDAASALSALEDLVEAIEQAGKWTRRAKVDPVIINYLPPSSSLTTPLLTPLLGNADNARGILDLPVEFNKLTNAFEINPVNLSVARRGLWLGEEETSTTSAAIENPGKMTVTFTNSVNIPSPLKLSLDSDMGSAFLSGLIFVSNDDAKIIFIESDPTENSGANWSTVADADASNGSYERLTPADTSTRLITSVVGSINSAARRFSVYAAIRNKSTTISYALTLSFHDLSENVFTCRTITIDTSDQTTRMIHIGIGSLPLAGEGLWYVQVSIVPSGTGGASEALEYDYLVVLAMDEYSRALEFSTSLANDLTFDACALTYPDPVVSTVPTLFGFTRVLRTDGDAFLIHAGNELCVLVCGQSGASWRLGNGISTYVSFALTAYRRRGYLVPQ